MNLQQAMVAGAVLHRSGDTEVDEHMKDLLLKGAAEIERLTAARAETAMSAEFEYECGHPFCGHVCGEDSMTHPQDAESLRAEVERVKANYQSLYEIFEKVFARGTEQMARAEKAEAENEKLRAENERLRAALRDMVPDEVSWKEGSRPSCLIDHPVSVLQSARAALQRKAGE